jgi:hypothetical protein
MKSAVRHWGSVLNLQHVEAVGVGWQLGDAVGGQSPDSLGASQKGDRSLCFGPPVGIQADDAEKVLPTIRRANGNLELDATVRRNRSIEELV